jgi:hypothetical protein
MPSSLLSAVSLMRLKSQLQSLGRYAAVQGVLLAVLGVLLTLAVGFGITAATIWLATQLGAAAAFAIVAAVLVVVAMPVQIAIVVRKRQRVARPSLLGEGEPSAQMALGSLAALAVIGYLLGRRTERR